MQILTDHPQDWSYRTPGSLIGGVIGNPIDDHPEGGRHIGHPGLQKGEPIPGGQANGSYMDHRGKVHDVYIDAAGVPWFIAENAFTYVPMAYMTASEWEAAFDPIVHEIDVDDPEDDIIQTDLNAAFETSERFKKNMRERAQRMKAKINEDRRLERAQHFLDVNHPAYRLREYTQEQMAMPPEQSHKRTLEDPLDFQSPPKRQKTSFKDLSELKRPQLSIVIPPPRELLEFSTIPGEGNIPVEDLPQGFPGTENRVEVDLNPFHRNVGPLNTVSSLSEAVNDSKESLAAWRHDIAYSAAQTTQDVIDADNAFIWELDQIPPEERGFAWYIYRNAINSGVGQIWHKVRPRKN